MGHLPAIITRTKGLCSLFWLTDQLLLALAGPHTQAGQARPDVPEQCSKQAPGRCVMGTSWWLWALVAVCTGDQFRDEAERIMRGTPVIDG